MFFLSMTLTVYIVDTLQHSVFIHLTYTLIDMLFLVGCILLENISLI